MNLLLKFSAHDVREYFKFAVRVSSEPSIGCYAVLINNTKSTELFVSVILIPVSSN